MQLKLIKWIIDSNHTSQICLTTYISFNALTATKVSMHGFLNCLQLCIIYQLSSRVFYHHINFTPFLDIEFIPLPRQLLAYWCSSQCHHFQQFYNRHNVKVHVSIIRWSHCVAQGSKCLLSSWRYLLLKLSATTIICVDNVLSDSLDRLSDTDSSW